MADFVSKHRIKKQVFAALKQNAISKPISHWNLACLFYKQTLALRSFKSLFMYIQRREQKREELEYNRNITFIISEKKYV